MKLSIKLQNKLSALENEEPPTRPSEECNGKNSHIKLSSPACEVSASSGRITADHEHDLLHIQGKISGHHVTMLIDSSSTHDFILERFIKKHGILTTKSSNVLNVTLADGSSRSQPMQTTDTLKTVVRSFTEHQRFVMFLLTRYDVILGKPWLTRTNPQINFCTNEVKVNSESISLGQKMSGQDSEVSRSTIESFFIPGRQARHALRIGAEGVLAWVSVTGEESREAETSSKDKNAAKSQETIAGIFSRVPG